MKKARIAIISIILLAIIILLIVRANSFSISLSNAGFHSKDAYLIDHGFDNNKKEFKVIQTVSKENKISLINLFKNNFGFWVISDSNIAEETNPNLVSLGWIQSGGAKRYLPSENAEFEQEWHMIYSGNNALKLIEFTPGQIPDNVTVNIQQAGESFWIHLITFAEPDVLNSIDMKSILQDNQCIPKS